MKTRYLLIPVLMAILATGSVSCRKSVEQQYEDILKKMMVDGSWTISAFSEDSVDITSSFNGWICKFHDDNTMTATSSIALGAGTQTGTWQSNLAAQSITAQFNNTVTDPLKKINGTWTITSSAVNKGKFSQTKDGKNYIMELTKY